MSVCMRVRKREEGGRERARQPWLPCLPISPARHRATNIDICIINIIIIIIISYGHSQSCPHSHFCNSIALQECIRSKAHNTYICIYSIQLGVVLAHHHRIIRTRTRARSLSLSLSAPIRVKYGRAVSTVGNANEKLGGPKERYY